MIHFHPFLSSQSILQLARILSLILLAKFSCAAHATGTGLAAEAPPARGHEPNDFTKRTTCGRTDINVQGSSACAASTTLVRVMQLLLFSPRSTMRRSWVSCLHHCSVRRKKQVRTNQKFITREENNSGRRSSSFRSNIW